MKELGLCENLPETEIKSIEKFNPYLIETPFDAFANRADPDQTALIRAA